MLCTIVIGSCILAQGLLVRTLPDGRVAVRIGANILTGRPVQKSA